VRFSEGLGLVVDVVNTTYLYGSTAGILSVLQHSFPENILFHLSPALELRVLWRERARGTGGFFLIFFLL
jgi:hypothetical protein